MPPTAKTLPCLAAFAFFTLKAISVSETWDSSSSSCKVSLLSPEWFGH